MTRIRSKRQRSLGFEPLEGRLALSAGVGMAVASHHAHEVPMSQIQKTIPASFKGHSQLLERLGAGDYQPERDDRQGPLHRLGHRDGIRQAFPGRGCLSQQQPGEHPTEPQPCRCQEGKRACKAERRDRGRRRDRKIRSGCWNDRDLEHMERPRQAHCDLELFGILQSLVQSRGCWVRRVPGSARRAGPSVEVQGGAPPASSRHSRPSTPDRTRVRRQRHVRAATWAWVNVPINRENNVPRHIDIPSAAGFCEHSRMPAAAS